MLPKKKRVTKKLFSDILEKGSAVHGSLFIFRSIPSPTPLYAFVAPKSVAKRAIDRNRLRRQGYNVLRKISLPLRAGVFFYKKQNSPNGLPSIKEEKDKIYKDISLIFQKLDH